MRYRRFGRLGWEVSEIGYGMWGMGGWSGSSDEESLGSLTRAIELGCNFFDTAWAYGNGHSETLLRETLRRHRDRRLYVATKIPPKNGRWPALGSYTLDEVFPADHIREYTEKSLENLGVDAIDLQQCHVWTDEWSQDERWQRAVRDLKDAGLIRGFGISVNRWEPANVLKALETGLVDSVQVVYNLFDQAPEDALFPACERLGVAVIARVPFDEGSLTGSLRADSTWPDGDWRNIYFSRENLAATIDRVKALGPAVPPGMDLPELALRFILHHPAVSTTIPGMRKPRHVERNLGVSDGRPLEPGMLRELRRHRWDRTMVIP
jgi:aryl-alcohol dehydrogenase-like predicted oxidoreductase